MRGRMPDGFRSITQYMRMSFTAVCFTLIAAAPLHAATVNDFYASLLKRGVDHVTTGAYEAGAGELKLAAFGLVDSLEMYQTAEIYLAIASQHLNRETQTRAAATRVCAAERIEPHYAKLALPETVRKEFDAIAQKVLTATQFETLRAK
jgi:hypothetical protein